jgi:hypothetical protein
MRVRGSRLTASPGSAMTWLMCWSGGVNFPGHRKREIGALEGDVSTDHVIIRPSAGDSPERINAGAAPFTGAPACVISQKGDI